MNRRWPTRKLALVALTMAAMITGCGDGEVTGGPLPVPVTQVTVSPETGPWSGILTVGDTITFRARAYTAGGVEVPAAGTSWTTTQPSRATVSGSGRVVALAPGAVEVWAAVGGVVGHASIDIVPAWQPAPATILVDPTAVALNLDQNRQLSAVVLDSRGIQMPNAAVVWTSENPVVASITPTGLLVSHAVGTARIVARAEGASAAVTVTVTNPTPQPRYQIYRMDGTEDFRGLNVPIGETLRTLPNGSTVAATIVTRVGTLSLDTHLSMWRQNIAYHVWAYYGTPAATLLETLYSSDTGTYTVDQAGVVWLRSTTTPGSLIRMATREDGESVMIRQALLNTIERRWVWLLMPPTP